MSEDDVRVAKKVAKMWVSQQLDPKIVSMYKDNSFDVFKIIITLAFCGLFMGMLFKFQTDLMKTKFMFVM